jgi:hypothetical protein
MSYFDIRNAYSPISPFGTEYYLRIKTEIRYWMFINESRCSLRSIIELSSAE